MTSLLPGAISKETSRILVQPTLQVSTADEPNPDIPIFAFGDVADHNGPRMARAGWMQAGVVLGNILSMIGGKAPLRIYRPNEFIEGAIKLTLGKTHSVIYAIDANGSDVLVPAKNGSLDLDIERVWKMYGADLKLANKPAGGL